MRASARVASEESVRQEIMDQLAGVEQLMARSSERSNSRMEALRFCVTSSGRERDYWRARAMRAEEKEKVWFTASCGCHLEHSERIPVQVLPIFQTL